MMNVFKQAVVIISMIEKLKEKGNWCGETSIQKAFYLFKSLFANPIDYDFILYKHGPYSFELSNQLAFFLDENLLKLEPQPKYSPRILVSDTGLDLRRRFPKTVKKFKDSIDFVANILGDKNIYDLEKISTAIYVIKEKPEYTDNDSRATFIHKKKKHISFDDALKSLDDAQQIIIKAESNS